MNSCTTNSGLLCTDPELQEVPGATVSEIQMGDYGCGLATSPTSDHLRVGGRQLRSHQPPITHHRPLQPSVCPCWGGGARVGAPTQLSAPQVTTS